MSCISTLYTLPILLEEAFCEAKANEKREIQKKILFLTRRETVGEKYLWEFLDEVCTKKKEPDYSGFYVIDYLWTYLQIDRIQCFTPVDDNYQKLSHEGAKSLSVFLETNPPDIGRLEEFWKKENEGIDTDIGEDLDTFLNAHKTIHQWAAEIKDTDFGVLYLSF